MHDGVERAADHRAFDFGDGAEGAGAAAAISDFQVGACALNAGTQYAALVQPDDFGFVRQVVERFGVLAGADAADEVEDVHPAARADHTVQAGDFLHEVSAVTLGEAARRNDHLPAIIDQFAQGIDGFLLGGVNKRRCSISRCCRTCRAGEAPCFQNRGVFRAAEAADSICLCELPLFYVCLWFRECIHCRTFARRVKPQPLLHDG